MKTTKELARELGLLRKRTLSCSSAAQKQTKSTDQQFAYLIIIDFESTCWKDDKFKSQEIIEFPAVLLNTSSGEIESEFHHYVQPQEQPTLSAFCTELTGITQDKVDDGIPINFCLKRFCHWLDKLQREKNVFCYGQTSVDGRTASCTFVTWSDWDLGVCLQYECKRKQLLKPVQLTSWIDLRATYRKFYDRKPNGLNGALQDLGIQFEGREHSGLDDSRNTAKLAFRMIQDGCVLKVTKTLKPQEKAPSRNSSISKHFLPATRITPPRKAKKATTPTKPIVQNSSALPKQSDQGNLKSRIPKPVRVIKGNEAGVNQKKTPVKVNVNGELSSPCAGTDSPARKRRKKYDGSSSPANKLLNSANGNSQHSVKTTLYKNKMSSLSQKSKIPNKTLKKISPTTFKPKDIYLDPVDSKLNLEQSEQTSNNQKTGPGLSEQDMNIKIASKNTDDENEERNLEKIFKKPISPRLNPTAPRIAKTHQSFGNSGCIGISATTQHNSSQQYKPKTLPVKRGNTMNKFQTSTPKSSMGAPNGFIKSSIPSPINSSLSSNSAMANMSPPGTPVNMEGQPISKSASSVHSATSTAAVFKTPSPVSVSRNSVDSRSASSKFMTPIPVTLIRSSTDSGNSSTMFKTPSPVAVTRNLSASGNTTSVFKTPSVSVAKSLVDSGNSSSVFKTPSPVSVTRNTVDSGNSSSVFKTPSSVSVSRNSIDSGNSSSMFKTPSPVSVTRSSVDSGNSSSVFKTPSSVATSSSSSVTGSAMKCTPPLCKCGRRSKRRMVQSPGQNMGRFFFSCSVRQSVGSKNGCDFFKWETSFNQSNTTSRKSPYVGKQFTTVTGGYFKTPTVRGGSYKAPTVGGFKKNLGMRSVSNTPACTFRV